MSRERPDWEMPSTAAPGSLGAPVAVSVEPRRGQPDGQPAIEAEQVLAVARGVVGAAAGGNQQVVDAGTEQLRGPFRGLAPLVRSAGERRPLLA